MQMARVATIPYLALLLLLLVVVAQLMVEFLVVLLAVLEVEEVILGEAQELLAGLETLHQ